MGTRGDLKNIEYKGRSIIKYGDLRESNVVATLEPGGDGRLGQEEGGGKRQANDVSAQLRDLSFVVSRGLGDP